MSNKRVKPAAFVVADLKQAAAALARLADLDRQLGEIEANMNALIDTAKASAAAESDALQAEVGEKQAALAAFAQMQKAELFAQKKSREFPHGIIGFRKSTSLVTLSKIKMAMVLERLKELGFLEAVSTKESVNKEAMREWPAERLQSVGMKRKSKDEFYIELKRETLEQ